MLIIVSDEWFLLSKCIAEARCDRCWVRSSVASVWIFFKFLFEFLKFIFISPLFIHWVSIGVSNDLVWYSICEWWDSLVLNCKTIFFQIDTVVTASWSAGDQGKFFLTFFRLPWSLCLLCLLCLCLDDWNLFFLDS